MATEVSICNLGLAHLGNRAAVTSISPPDQSVEAALCAQFYPMARDAVLEMYNWGFSKRRATLAEVTNPSTTWLYAYSVPNLKVNIISILEADALDDYSVSAQYSAAINGNFQTPGTGHTTPRDFDVETQADGTEIILTNVANAVCRHTVVITDTSKFSPLFTLAVSHMLASMVAGPLLKGERGEKANIAQLKLAEFWVAKAVVSDANDRQVRPIQQVGWVNARG